MQPYKLGGFTLFLELFIYTSMCMCVYTIQRNKGFMQLIVLSKVHWKSKAWHSIMHAKHYWYGWGLRNKDHSFIHIQVHSDKFNYTGVR